MLAMSGIIAASSAGWPGIFYISGALGVVWSVAFFVFGSNSPSEYSSITKAEREYIESMPGSSNDKNKIIPWREIFKSKPFWALLISHCAQNWGFWTLLTQTPSYMKHVLNFDIKSVRVDKTCSTKESLMWTMYCFPERIAVRLTVSYNVGSEYGM